MDVGEIIEIESTYLAKGLPEGLDACESIELKDIYIPGGSPHAKLRIRQKGDKYELTKKTIIDAADAGNQTEETIELSKEEFDALAQADGRMVEKTRYFYPYNGKTTEIDVFRRKLAGLVLVDVEFDSPEDKAAFRQPDFCLVDVTQEEFIAGGVLAGQAYEDITDDLARFDYKSLSV